MMTKQLDNKTIDNFAKGWIANRVRHEPIDKLKSRFRLYYFILPILCVLFILIEIFGWGGLTRRFIPIRLDVLLGVMILLLAVSAYKMKRFIMFRETLDVSVDLADGL